MKRQNVIILLAAIICVSIIIGATAYAQKSGGGPVKSPTDVQTAANAQSQIQAEAAIDSSLMKEVKYQYTAKFICGEVKQDATQQNMYNMPSPGDYRTLVNIHNPQPWNVTIRKKVVIASEEEPWRPIQPVWAKSSYLLQPDYAFRMDCSDIYKINGTTPGTFIEGFVVLFAQRQLDATALYTASPGPGVGVSTMHTEVIKPKVSGPASAYVD